MTKYEQAKYFYNLGMWHERELKNAVVKNWITPDEYEKISGKKYE